MSDLQNQETEIVLSFADVKAIYRRRKKTVFLGGLIGFCLAGLIALLQPIQYTSKGTFHEKGKDDAMFGDSMAASLIKGESKERTAKSAIKSRKILESAIKQLNLQAFIQKESGLSPIFDKLHGAYRNIFNNLKAEYALLTGYQGPVLIDPVIELTADNVIYDGEIPLIYQIVFIDHEKFAIKHPQNGVEIGRGILGTPFDGGHFKLTLQKPAAAEQGHIKENSSSPIYNLYLWPISEPVLEFSKNLIITNSFESKSFLELIFKYPFRHGAASILNGIMDSYREHLLEEHHRLVLAQVDYLHFRKKEIDEQTTKLIEEQALQISTPINNLELLVSTQHALNKKLLSNELKIKQLQNGNYENCCLYSIDDDSKIFATLQKKIIELQHDRQSYDTILAALDRQSQAPLFTAQDSKNFDVMQSLRKQFDGIDSETAKILYSTCCQELHEIEGEIAQNHAIISEVQQPSFEISSLSRILKDKASQNIVSSANQISIALNDQHNRTAREIERLEKDLSLQKNFLATHLEQTNERLGIRYELLKMQTYAIHQAMGDLLSEKISIGEKHLSDHLSASIDMLKQEEKIIKQQQQELQQQLKKLPQQWASEKLVDLHLQANSLILQQIGNLIETKNIADNLETSLSAPFDRAIPPVQPNSPHLLLFMLLGAFFGAFGTFAGLLASSAAVGIHASKENLMSSGQHVSGEFPAKFDPCSEKNLPILRRLASFLCAKEQVSNLVLLLLGNCGDYSGRLAALLAKRGQKVLVIPITFDVTSSTDEGPGLLQYFEDDQVSLKIVKRADYDLLLTGGITAYGSELLDSAAFNRLLQRFQAEYTWIILVSKELPLSAEGLSLFQNYSNIAISLKEEKLHELQNHFFEASKMKKKNITYLLNIT